MILVSDLVLGIKRNGLDADGSDHYNNERNYFPAINSAIRWVIAVAQYAIGQKRLSEEHFGELSSAQVYQTTTYSRIQLEDVWGILAVYALPTCIVKETGASASISSNTNKQFASLKRTDLMHISSNYPCKRLTIEEWSSNIGNPYFPGNTIVTSGDLLEHAYLTPFDYTHTTVANNITTYYRNFIELRPVQNEKLVTVFQLNVPSDVSSESDGILFNKALFGILVQKATQYVSYQQGDNTDIWNISKNDVDQLTIAMLS